MEDRGEPDETAIISRCESEVTAEPNLALALFPPGSDSETRRQPFQFY